MTKYTQNETYDKLVISYVYIRVCCLAIIVLLVGPQLVYEIKRLWRSKSEIGAKFLVLVTLFLFPIFRIIDQLCYLYIPPYNGVGTWAWRAGVISTYFLFAEWMFIGTLWTQLIYTYFASNSIILKNSKRAFLTSIILAIIFGVWNLFVLIYGSITPTYASHFYSIGFVVFVISIGFAVVIHGLILTMFLKKQHNKSMSIQHHIKKTLRLSITLAIFLGLILVREIVWFALKLGRTSPYRHITVVIVAICEILQSIVVMKALSNNFMDYLLFKPVSNQPQFNSSEHIKIRPSKQNELSSGILEEDVSSQEQNQQYQHQLQHSKDFKNDNNKLQIQIDSNSTTDFQITSSSSSHSNNTIIVTTHSKQDAQCNHTDTPCTNINNTNVNTLDQIIEINGSVIQHHQQHEQDKQQIINTIV